MLTDQRLDISETGRGKDREFVCLLEGSKMQRRQWAIEFAVADQMRGLPKATAFLDGQRVRPTAAEVRAAQAPYHQLATETPAAKPTRHVTKPLRGAALRRRLRRH